MATMTFQINDASAGSTNPAVWVTITDDNGDGTLTFNVWQEGGIVGDLRGIFFDVADESILKSLVVSAASTDIRIGDDTIKDLGDGANMNGLLGSDKGYDVGIEIGTSGIGKDDISSYSFTLDSTLRDLTLKDFSQVDFGARLTSVGVINGARADSSKIVEVTSQAISLKGATSIVTENEAAIGNVLSNITLAGTTKVTAWTGGELGTALALTDASDGGGVGIVHLMADGSYEVDASGADRLSAGETLVFDLRYSARNQDESTSWSTDSALFRVAVKGVNDGPEANDDEGGAVKENEILTGSVVDNDTDIDRLDTHAWALQEGSFNGQGSLTMNADGSWSYDAQGAYDSLYEGEFVDLSFEYVMTDNHGASESATVTFRVEGVGQIPLPPAPPPEPEPEPEPDPSGMFPDMLQAISNVVIYLDDGDAATALQKVKLTPSMTLYDVDDLMISQFIATHSGAGSFLGSNTQMVGISVHAGQEYPNVNGVDGTKQGEGSFFYLMDGENPNIAAVGSRDASGGWTLDWEKDDYPLSAEAMALGFTNELLNATSENFLFTGMWA